MTFATTAALIGGGAGILGSIIGARGSQSAAQTSANAANQASQASLALQREMWLRGLANQEPWRLAGVNALGQMQAAGPPQGWRNFSMTDYQQDPGYQFRLSEGLKALEHSAAARGGLLSGSTLKGAERYGQDLASQEYVAAYNRFNTNQMNELARTDMTYNRQAALAGIGQTTATSMANQGNAYGVNAGNTTAAGINAAGQANAAGILGQSNAWNNGINNAVSSYQQANMMNWLRPQNYPSTSPSQAAVWNQQYGYAPNERGW